MHRTSFRLIPGAFALAFASTPLLAQNTAGSAPADGSLTSTTAATSRAKDPLVEFEMMTWPEVKDAIAAGKTTALFYTGGTEQRGPQNVNGGHTLMGTRDRQGDRAQARQRDRDAGAAVHAEQRERDAARHDRPHARDPRRRCSSASAEQAIATGFKNVVLMGDHGGGQPNVYARRRQEARRRSTRRRASTSTSATRSTPRRRATSTSGSPRTATRASSHAGIPDTSEMLYLGGDRAGSARS